MNQKAIERKARALARFYVLSRDEWNLIATSGTYEVYRQAKEQELASLKRQLGVK